MHQQGRRNWLTERETRNEKEPLVAHVRYRWCHTALPTLYSCFLFSITHEVKSRRNNTDDFLSDCTHAAPACDWWCIHAGAPWRCNERFPVFALCYTSAGLFNPISTSPIKFTVYARGRPWLTRHRWICRNVASILRTSWLLEEKFKIELISFILTFAWIIISGTWLSMIYIAINLCALAWRVLANIGSVRNFIFFFESKKKSTFNRRFVSKEVHAGDELHWISNEAHDDDLSLHIERNTTGFYLIERVSHTSDKSSSWIQKRRIDLTYRTRVIRSSKVVHDNWPRLDADN